MTRSVGCKFYMPSVGLLVLSVPGRRIPSLPIISSVCYLFISVFTYRSTFNIVSFTFVSSQYSLTFFPNK